jgi:hypothetical protein
VPLTFAHAAAVLPLGRQLPFSALIVGSMAPDLIYFARLAPRGHFGHTLPGLFLFCLPAGLTLLWIFHRLIKRPAYDLAPLAAQRRLAPYLSSSPFSRPHLTALAVLTGAVTHVIWDAFTHAEAWGVELVPLLQHTFDIGGAIYAPGYSLMQHGSTLLGLAVLALSSVLWWVRAKRYSLSPRLSSRSRAVRVAALVGPSFVFAAGYAAAHAAHSGTPLAAFLGRFVVSSTTALFLAVLLYAATLRIANRRR